MKDEKRMNDTLHWILHLFWMLGMVYKHLGYGRLDLAEDMWGWVKVHVTYRPKCISQGTFEWHIVTLGIVITLLVLFIVCIGIYDVIIGRRLR